MSYYSSDSELVLMAPIDDSMAHLFPVSTCHSSPDMLYSPPLQHMPLPQTTTLPSNAPIFAYAHDYREIMNSPYPSQSPWPAHSAPLALPQISSYSLLVAVVYGIAAFKVTFCFVLNRHKPLVQRSLGNITTRSIPLPVTKLTESSSVRCPQQEWNLELLVPWMHIEGYIQAWL
ncbi:hypothetical protein ACEQ8H_000919 [Pleosporales sp. CAS-2024a]